MKALKEIEKKCLGNIILNGKFNHLGHSVLINKKNVLTFCDDIKFLPNILENKCISSLITLPEFIDAFIDKGIGLISSKNPRFDFFTIHNSLAMKNKTFQTKIGNNTNFASSCIISENNVSIGDNCYFEDNVIIHPNVKIGNNVIIRSGTIIGGQGFQFWKSETSVLKIEHFGKVEIQDNVEIKEFCSIHCALFNWDTTYIGFDSKIDAHTHIGHGNKIGDRVYICSHANMSGNSIIGNDCYVGPGVNIPNRVKIGERSKLTVGATITKDVPSQETVSGNFAIAHDKYLNHIKKISNHNI